jgi:hypothetical protein
MVFHEITRSAIDEAVRNTRDVDQQLVDAAEARRVLDRLFGYTLSPILWRKVNRGLSAGRVQSPAIRLVVEREQERMDYVVADYWDLAAITATAPSFKAVLSSLNGMRVASGRDFDSKGVPRDGVSVITKERADELTAALTGDDLNVRSIDEKPYRKSPKAPFITSSLQQEAGNKLRLSAGEVMRIAQGLYESGFITYMRTDNVGLSDDAIAAASQGIDTDRVKLLAFVLSALVAGVSGVVAAHFLNAWNPRLGNFDASITCLAFVVFGGSRTWFGPVVGGLALTALPELLRPVGDLRLIVFGLVILLGPSLFPQGLINPALLQALARRLPPPLRRLGVGTTAEASR